MTKEYRIYLDLKAFRNSLNYFRKDEFPRLVASVLSTTTGRGKKQIRSITEARFNLRTGWIPRNINNFPRTPAQKSKIARDIKTTNNFWASVEAGKRISYMYGHEYGEYRMPTKGQKNLAIPNAEIADSLKAPSGKIRNRFKPKELTKGAKIPRRSSLGRSKGLINKNVVSSKTAPVKLTKPKAFFIRSRKTGQLLIVRRLYNRAYPIEIIYGFKRGADIKERWDFIKTGLKSFSENLHRDFERAWNKLK